MLVSVLGASDAWAVGAGCSTTETASNAATLAAAINCANSNGADTTIEVTAPIDITGTSLPALTAGTTTSFTGSAITSTTATGTSDLQQSGTGTTQILTTGLSAYTGGTSVMQGTLQAGAANVFGPLSDYEVDTPGSLDLNNNDQTLGSLSGSGTVTLGTATLTVGGTGQNTTFSGTISGSGGVTLDPSQGYTTTLTGAQQNVNFVLQGAQAYTGATTVDVGFLILDSGASVAGPIQINTGTTPQGDTYGGTLSISGSAGAVTVGNTVSGTGGIAVGSEQVTFTGDLSGYTGRIQVDGSASTPGAFIVGTNAFGNGSVDVVVDVNGAFDLNGHAVTIQGIGDGTNFGQNPANVGTVLLNGGTLTLGTSTGGFGSPIDYFAGTIQDGATPGGSLVKVGSNTLQLVAANGYTGGTLLNAGQISVVSNALGSGLVTMADATTIAFAQGVTSLNNAFLLNGTSVAANFDTGGNVGIVSGAISGAGGLNKTGASSLLLTGTDTYSGGTTISAGILQIGGGGTTGSIVGDVSDSGELIFARSDALTYNGIVSGSGSLGNVGSGPFSTPSTGVLTLTGANTYAGGTYLNGGTLQVTNATLSGGATVSSSIGTGTLFMFGGTLQAAADLTLANPVTIRSGGGTIDSGGHALTLTGAITDGATPGLLTFASTGGGMTVLAGNNTSTSGAAVTGTVALAAANALGAGPLQVTGTVDLAGFDQAVTTLTGSGTVLNTGRFDGAPGTISANTLTAQSGTFSGALTDGQATVNGLPFAGTLGLTKSSDGTATGGTLVLAGTSTYTGATTVAAGTLQAGSTAALSPASPVTVAAGATLDIAGFTSEVGSLAGAGTVIDSGAAGTLTTGRLGTSTTFSGLVADNGGALTLHKVGAGTLSLTGANTYTGGTTLEAGTLAVGDAGALGSGTLSMAAGTTLAFLGSFTLPNDVALGGAVDPTIDTGTNDDTMSGVISGGGTLTKEGSGTLTLTGVNTYTGGTVIAAGTLVGSATSFGSGGLADNAALVFNQATDAAFANPISGAGTLTKTGGGTLDLTGVSTLSGPTAVSGGTLVVDGSLANSAVTVGPGAVFGGLGTVGSFNALGGSTVAPGVATPFSALKIGGGVAFGPGSTYRVAIDPSGRTDSIQARGAATLAGGTVDVITNGTGYSAATTYTLLTAARGVNGTFSGLTTPTTLAFLAPTLRYSADAVTLGFSSNGVPFAAVATTPNQRAVAGAVQRLGGGSPVFTALQGLTATGARAALDALSGAPHASVVTAATQDAARVSGLVFDRLWTIGGGGIDARTLLQQLAPGDRGSLPVNCFLPMPAAAPPPTTYTVWGEAFGDFGHDGGNANGAGLDRSTGGFVLGIDTPIHGFTAPYRVGFAGGYSNDTLHATGAAGGGSFQSVFGTLYGGARYGAVDVRAGASVAGTVDRARPHRGLPRPQRKRAFRLRRQHRTGVRRGRVPLHGHPLGGRARRGRRLPPRPPGRLPRARRGGGAGRCRRRQRRRDDDPGHPRRIRAGRGRAAGRARVPRLAARFWRCQSGDHARL